MPRSPRSGADGLDYILALNDAEAVGIFMRHTLFQHFLTAPSIPLTPTGASRRRRIGGGRPENQNTVHDIILS